MRRIDDSTKFRMFVVWAAALFTFLVPSVFVPDAVKHFVQQPLFLLIVPLALAFLSIYINPRPPLTTEEQEERRQRKRKAGGWTVLLQISVLVAAFLGWVFVDLLHDGTIPHAERLKDCLELMGLILIPLVGAATALTKLKKLGHLLY